jgi:L-alanine-DL-glutamate epimerase-like enolase superfamily enzyme
LLAALPNAGPLEWDALNSSIIEELFIEPLVVRDGRVQIPELPGLGIHLPDEVRATYAL